MNERVRPRYQNIIVFCSCCYFRMKILTEYITTKGFTHCLKVRILGKDYYPLKRDFCSASFFDAVMDNQRK